MSLIIWTILAFLGYLLANNLIALRRNIAAAKRSGLPYIITPWFHFNALWIIQAKFWLPYLNKLPSRVTQPWLSMLNGEWIWQLKRKPFEDLGSDIFLVVSPGMIIANVANAEAINEISTRRNDFPKPIHIYRMLNLYGRNVVTTEGAMWRQHRKITAPPFAEKNNQLVWRESLKQAQSLMHCIMGKSVHRSNTVYNLAESTMRLSLHIISYAGFGVKSYWPHEETEEAKRSRVIPTGHTMSYQNALVTVLNNLLQAILLPRWWLKYSPLKKNRTCDEALTNWGQYMQGLHDIKQAQLSSETTSLTDENMDLMGALLKGSRSESASTTPSLSTSEILGNAFVFILAGHETTANVLFFSCIFLALNPSSQKALQTSLDEIFPSTNDDVEQWSYDTDLPRLFNGMACAVMNETLRLFPPVVAIPKSTITDQEICLENGKKVIIPGKSLIAIDTVASGLNTDYFPCDEPFTNQENMDVNSHEDPKQPLMNEKWSKDEDIKKWRPERWLVQNDHPSHIDSNKAEPNGEVDEKQSSSIFHPTKGAYVPFSDGQRSCLGRRFAQVEILAVLAVVFKKYTVELVVEDILGPEFPSFTNVDHNLDGKAESEVKQEAKNDVTRQEWMEAKTKVENLIQKGCASIITLQLRRGKVPIRFVERGHESYNWS